MRYSYPFVWSGGAVFILDREIERGDPTSPTVRRPFLTGCARGYIFNVLNMLSTVFQPDSDIFRALGNPKRLEIIQLLRAHALTVTQIRRMTGLSQANISQHLQVLRQERLVVPQREGKEITYALAHHNVAKAFDAVHGILVDRKKSRPWKLSTKQAIIPQVSDPVCHMAVSPETAVFFSQFKRSTYYFCASGCKVTFEKNPMKYIS